ncbi:MAG: hypothetical protein EOP00_30070 [Pedobacter sp.]|nr:MAG: hypothetical protein EOP00_30070 [Pedobacter sp.]
MSLPKFLISYSIFTGILAGIALLLPAIFPSVKLLTNQFWLIFWFLGGLTLIAYILADLGIKRKPETGVFSILGAVILKMLFSMSFVLIYSLKHPESDLLFVFNFFSLYLLFTLFEILGLLRNLRHQNK